MKIIVLMASVVSIAPLVHGQPGAADAFEQNRRLGRGVNIIGYDPIWRLRDQARFQDKHFRFLKEARFQFGPHQSASVSGDECDQRLVAARFVVRGA